MGPGVPSAAAAAKLLQSCPTLCNPMDSSPPGFSVHRIFQARILEWVATSFSKIKTAAAAATKSLQSCPTLCNPRDSSQPGSSVHGILQARILVRVAMPPSRGSSQPRNQTFISCIASRFFYHWPTREVLIIYYMLLLLLLLSHISCVWLCVNP